MFAQNSSLVKQVASAKATTVPQYTKNQESEAIEDYNLSCHKCEDMTVHVVQCSY